MNSVDILIISNKLDFASDYVCLELNRRKASYLRLNRDEFDRYKVIFNVDTGEIKIKIGDLNYCINQNCLTAIYYRAPIYLRDIYKPRLNEREQLFRTQWTAFIRNLSVFENVIWMNNPVATFKAENKLLQLKYAHNIGMLCPKTVVTNTNAVILENNKDIRFSVFGAASHIKSKGYEIKADTMVPMLTYLNELGGRVLLDMFSREELTGLLIEYVDQNIDIIIAK